MTLQETTASGALSNRACGTLGVRRRRLDWRSAKRLETRDLLERAYSTPPERQG